MANGSVYDKIIQKGEQDALEIKKQGEEKANNITEQIIKETKERVDKMIHDTKIKNADLVKTKLAELEQTKKQTVLTNQKQIINETFSVVLEKLIKMNDAELTHLVKHYLKNANLNESIKIKVSSGDYNRYQKLFSSKQNNNLDILSKEFGYDIELSNETATIKGGFIIESSYFDVDNSYEVILENLENNLETKVAEMLFRKEA